MKRQASKRRKSSTEAENVALTSEVAVQTDEDPEEPLPAIPAESVEIKKEPLQQPDEEMPLVQDEKMFKIFDHGERQFAALESGFLTDVTILVGNEAIKCHSNIVSFASPKLSALLQKNEKPRLPDVNPLHFRLLLQIIYMSETSEPQDVETLLHVGRIAHDLQVHPAAYFCAREVESALDTGNLWGILDYADLIDDTKLTKACFKIFRNNAGYIIQTGGFLNCSGARIKSILRQETIYNVTELQLFQACVAWANANPDEVETRRAALSSALPAFIRFRKFSAEEFAEHVSPTRLLRAEDERDIYRSCVTGKNFMPEGFSESTSSRDPSQIMVLELSSGERKAFHKFPKNIKTSLKMSISRDMFIHGVKLLAYRSNLPDGCTYEENVWVTIHEKVTSDFKQQEASFRGRVKKGEMISVKFKYPIELCSDDGHYCLHVAYNNPNAEKYLVYDLYVADALNCGSNLKIKVHHDFVAPPDIHLIVTEIVPT